MKHYYSSYTVNLAWLQSSTREPWWLQYFKSLLLKMPIVTIWSVFQNQVKLIINSLGEDTHIHAYTDLTDKNNFRYTCIIIEMIQY